MKCEDFIGVVREALPHVDVSTTKTPFGLAGTGINIRQGSGIACDFCSTVFPLGTILAVYVAEDAWIDRERHGPIPPYRSIGDWAACRTCAPLIDADDRKGLAERSFSVWATKHGKHRARGARGAIRQSHDAFFRARKPT